MPFFLSAFSCSHTGIPGFLVGASAANSANLLHTRAKGQSLNTIELQELQRSVDAPGLE